MKYVLFALFIVLSFTHIPSSMANPCAPALSVLAPLMQFEGDEIAYKSKEALYNFLSSTGILPSKNFYMAIANTLDGTALKNMDGLMGTIQPKSLETTAIQILTKMTATYQKYDTFVTFEAGKAQASVDGIKSLKEGAMRAHQDFAAFVTSVEVMKTINSYAEIKQAVTLLIAETLPYFAKSAYYKAAAYRLEDQNDDGLQKFRTFYHSNGYSVTDSLNPLRTLFAPISVPVAGTYMAITHSARNARKIYNNLRGKNDETNPFRKADKASEAEDKTND